MSRLYKLITVTGFSSVYLMQEVCTTPPGNAHNGFSVFASVWSQLQAILTQFNITA